MSKSPKSDAIKAMATELGIPLLDIPLAQPDALNPEDYPLPDWAIGKTNGDFVLGAQLPTRDGRRMGNAHIIGILEAIHGGFFVYRCLTDAGSEIYLNGAELDECFYPPVYVSDVAEVTRKFMVAPEEEELIHGVPGL